MKKLYEFASAMVQIGDGGHRCDIEVTTAAVKEQFHIGGFSGWINQIPAYLGGCDIVSIEEKHHDTLGDYYLVII